MLAELRAAIAPYLLLIRLALWLAIASVLYVSGCRHGQRTAQQASAEAVAVQAQSNASAQARAREAEHASAERLNEIAEAYERGKRDAQATSDRVAANLRAGNLRLRNEWAGCETQRLSDAAASASVVDAGADDRSESAGRIVRAARECDAQVRALQALVRADRSAGQE